MSLRYNSAYFISLNTTYWEGGKKEGKERGREGERVGESINITRLSPPPPTCSEGREGRPACSNLGGEKNIYKRYQQLASWIASWGPGFRRFQYPLSFAGPLAVMGLPLWVYSFTDLRCPLCSVPTFSRAMSVSLMGLLCTIFCPLQAANFWYLQTYLLSPNIFTFLI